MKKKVLQLVMCVGMLFTNGLIASAAEAKNEIHLIVNGHSIVPIQEVLEVFNVGYTWDQTSQKISIQKDQQTLELEIGSYEIMINGTSKFIPTPALFIDNQPYIPVRIVGEALGLFVDWDAEQKKTLIQTPTLRTGMMFDPSSGLINSWQGHGN